VARLYLCKTLHLIRGGQNRRIPRQAKGSKERSDPICGCGGRPARWWGQVVRGRVEVSSNMARGCVTVAADMLAQIYWGGQVFLGWVSIASNVALGGIMVA